MHRSILRLSIPNILSNISIPLVGATDLALMGRTASEVEIGALGLGTAIFSFIYWSFGFLRMGTTGLTAQAYGKDNQPQQLLIFLRALLLAVGSGGLLLLFQWPLQALGFWAFSASNEVESAARIYFETRIWAAPATISLYVFMGWFLGMQNAFAPMLITILINLLNVGLSVYWVQVEGLHIRGVALGTVIAQYLGLLLAVGIWYWRYGAAYRARPILNFWSKLLNKEELIRFWTLNRDIFLRTFMLIFAMTFFTDRSAAFGESTLAINTLLLQFITWMAYGIDGFAFAAESLVGRYSGQGVTRQIKKAIRVSLLWGMGLALLISAIYALAHIPILGLFTGSKNQYLIPQALPYIGWIIALPLVATPCYIGDGVLVGLTASRSMRDTMWGAFLLYLLSYLLLIEWAQWGNHALWACLLLFMGTRGLLQGYWFWRGWVPLKSTH